MNVLVGDFSETLVSMSFLPEQLQEALLVNLENEKRAG